MKITVQVSIQAGDDAPTVVHEVLALERGALAPAPWGFAWMRPRTCWPPYRRRWSPGRPELPWPRRRRVPPAERPTATRTFATSWCGRCSAPCACRAPAGGTAPARRHLWCGSSRVRLSLRASFTRSPQRAQPPFIEDWSAVVMTARPAAPSRAMWCTERRPATRLEASAAHVIRRCGCCQPPEAAESTGPGVGPHQRKESRVAPPRQIAAAADVLYLATHLTSIGGLVLDGPGSEQSRLHRRPSAGTRMRLGAFFGVIPALAIVGTAVRARASQARACRFGCC
jgi:hypothetical protein